MIKKRLQDSQSKKNEPKISVWSLLKILLAMYAMTGVLLLALSVILYKMRINDTIVSVGIILIYVLSCFLGGLLSRKILKTRKFFGGMVMGGAYFLVLVLGSILFQKGINMELSRFFTTLVLCVASGILGGMVS